MNRRLVDVKDASIFLGISVNTLYAYSSQKRLIPVVHIGKKLLYDIEDLEKFIKKQKEEPKFDN